MKLERTLNNLRKFSFKGFGKPKLHFYKCPLTNSYNFDFNEFFVVKKSQQTGYSTNFIGGRDIVEELTTTLSNHLSVEIDREIFNYAGNSITSTIVNDLTGVLVNGNTTTPNVNGTIYSTVNSTTGTVNFDYTSLYPMWQTTTTL
jgi:hypothetical protein